MPNCLDCKKCLVCFDPDPIDSFNNDDMAALCTISTSKGKLCKELNYIMPLGYKSDLAEYPCAEDPWITVSSRPHQLRKECETPDWCPLNGKIDEGEHQIADRDDTAVIIMSKIRQQ